MEFSALPPRWGGPASRGVLPRKRAKMGSRRGSAPPALTKQPTLSKLDAGPGSPLAPGLARADSTISTKSASAHPARRRILSLAAIIAYLCSGLLIVVVNKSIVRDHGLHAPALVSSTGALFTAALTRLLVFFGKIHVRPVGKRPWEFAFRRALPVGFCAAGSLCFGNMSYIYLDAGFVQMLKAGTPALLLMVLSCLRVEAVSTTSACLAMAMVGGSALATAQQPHATTLGIVVQLASQFCEVLQVTAVQVFLQQLGFEAWDAGYYLAPAVAACCLLPSLVLEWPHVIASHKVGVLFQQIPLLIASGSIGIIVNFSSLLVIKFTSSLLAKLLVIARSSALVILFIIRGEAFTWLQVVGYVITLSAFGAYSVVKAREMEQQDNEPQTPVHSRDDGQADQGRESDEDLLEGGQSPGGGSSNGGKEVSSSWDLTSFMFWFAIFVVIAGGYQAAVVGELPTTCSLFTRQLASAERSSASSIGVPPTPYLEPITAGTHAFGNLGAYDESEGGEAVLDALGAVNVQSPAKVLFLADGRFLLHEHGKVKFQRRTPDSLLSASWMIISKQFGTVHLQALNNKGSLRWLSCDLLLVGKIEDACLFWMTAAQWDHWSSNNVGQYVLRRHEDDGLFLSADQSRIVWSQTPSAFHVADWVPEACPLQGMTASPHFYSDAKGEVTFTMTTFFKVYARSIMFRQALSSVFMYLKERDFYVKEFLVINDWYEGNALDFNGTFTGPDVHATRREMLAFFPGCEGSAVEAAYHRPAKQKCTFIFKDSSQQGQPKALNILLDLMVTKFWIQFEDDHVFYQDVYVSRLLAPMYEHPDSCWNYERHQESKEALLKREESLLPMLSRLSQQPGDADGTGEDYGGSRLRGKKGDSAEAFRQVPSQAGMGRRLANKQPCTVVGSVRLASKPALGGLGGEDVFEVEQYTAPDILYNLSYVQELLAHGGLDADKDHGWGAFKEVGAVQWPIFSLRPSLHNLSYIKSLEAPLFYGGRPGRFSEDPNITRWRDRGKTYQFHWDFELEFAVRWARRGATSATLSPGACMRDVSNGISSFEKGFDYR
uniref:Sugar phosphate transporter domain-containing protein n=1 Tax=Alexandrium monilatum TaxID=311494 RepID=A0A7S4QL33_9DINO